jgi:multidrug efflux system membrane fusion protein
VGTLAAPGAPAYAIADTSTVKVVFGVPDTLVASLRLGAPQRVGLEALPGIDQAGTITRISAAADPRGHVFEVEVSVPNPRGELRPGMVASLELGEGEGAPLTAAALVPLSAIVRAPGGSRGYAVFVLDDKAAPPVARAREVELGELLGNRIPVKSGLAEGDRVVVLGAGLLADGESVEVIQ